MELFVNGDLTLVGERRVTLGGVQTARVNLARMIDHCDNADIFLISTGSISTCLLPHLLGTLELTMSWKHSLWSSVHTDLHNPCVHALRRLTS